MIGSGGKKHIQDFGVVTIWNTRKRWEDNIKIDLKGNVCECGKWMKLAQKPVQ
jgi:hypothetical protein